MPKKATSKQVIGIPKTWMDHASKEVLMRDVYVQVLFLKWQEK